MFFRDSIVFSNVNLLRTICNVFNATGLYYLSVSLKKHLFSYNWCILCVILSTSLVVSLSYEQEALSVSPHETVIIQSCKQNRCEGLLYLLPKMWQLMDCFASIQKSDRKADNFPNSVSVEITSPELNFLKYKLQKWFFSFATTFIIPEKKLSCKFPL